MKYRFSKSLEGFSSSAVREILKLTQGSSIISFAGGLPAEEFFPLDAVAEAFQRVIGGGKSALQYGLTEGYKPLRESLCKRMAAKNMQVTPDEMLLTTGSQQAIDLLTRVYIDEGDVILVESPTYLAAIQVFQAKGAKIYSVDSDNDGMILEDLSAKIAKHNPKMVYVIPTFSNPAGRAWSLERRQGLLDICRGAEVLILEDDPYGEIQFDENETYPTDLLTRWQSGRGECCLHQHFLQNRRSCFPNRMGDGRRDALFVKLPVLNNPRICTPAQLISKRCIICLSILIWTHIFP